MKNAVATQTITTTLIEVLNAQEKAYNLMGKKQLLNRCTSYYKIPVALTKGLNKDELIQYLLAAEEEELEAMGY